MQTVGVRELKARLSAYLRKAEGGELFLVTDRGRVVAALGSWERIGAAPAANATDPVAAALVAAGARPPISRSGNPTEYPQSQLTAAEVDAMLAASRDEE